MLKEEIIRKHLNNKNNFQFKLYESVGSTNIVMRDFTIEPQGLVIAANEQTDGRGRLSNRRFFSPKDSGLYVSILLKPKQTVGDAALITSLAAVAVCETIEQLSDKKAMIKWVNDIYIDNKKVCGILTQGSVNAQGALDYAILGIGVNLITPAEGFPDELLQKAGAVFDGADDENIDSLFLASLLNIFFSYYEALTQAEIASRYRARSLVLHKNIMVLNGENSYNAYVDDIDDSCNLLITTGKENQKQVISSGEVSIIVT